MDIRIKTEKRKDVIPEQHISWSDSHAELVSARGQLDQVHMELSKKDELSYKYFKLSWI